MLNSYTLYCMRLLSVYRRNSLTFAINSLFQSMNKLLPVGKLPGASIYWGGVHIESKSESKHDKTTTQVFDALQYV